MAKGDHKRVENEINSQRQVGMDRTAGTYNTIAANNGNFGNNFNQASGMNLGSYNDIMGKYGDLYNNPFGPGGEGGGGGGGGIGGDGLYDKYTQLGMNGGGYGWDPEWRGAISSALGGFQNFADTGGFSDQNIQDMRARAIAPTRAVYANALNSAKRGQALGGGSPNFNSALAKMARENAYAIGDMNVNANAGIAQMVQQGKLAGLQGLSGTGLGAQDRSTNIDQLNAQMMLAGLSGMQGIQGANAAAGAARDSDMFDARMGVLGGMRQMYGTNPALLQTTGDQLLNSERNLLGANELGNNFGGQMINARLNNAQVPGNYQTALGNIGSTVKLAQGIVSPAAWASGGRLSGAPDNSKNAPQTVYGANPYAPSYAAYGATGQAPWEVK